MSVPQLISIDHVILDEGVLAAQMQTVTVEGTDHQAHLCTIGLSKSSRQVLHVVVKAIEMPDDCLNSRSAFALYNVNKHRPEVKIAMGRFLNPGNYLFQISLNSEIYVDKSGLIDCTNKVVSTGDRYVCVSRPRRFGKSTTADMLVAYYDRSCDSSIQFAGLEIAQSPSYRSHLNRYDVIHLNIQDFLSQSTSTKDMVAFIEESVEAELAAAYPEVPLPGRGGLSEHLSSVFSLHRSPFVFVIDEWTAFSVFTRTTTMPRSPTSTGCVLLLKDRLTWDWRI